MLDKKNLSERDICTKYITPALDAAGWDIHTQILEEVSFTDGKIYVRGKLTARGTKKRADYILYYKPNIPVAIIEAKDNHHEMGAGMQQALEYASILDIPCVFSSNGDGFVFHNRAATEGAIETDLSLQDFPSPDELWRYYCTYKGIHTPEEKRIASFDYYVDAATNPAYQQPCNGVKRYFNYTFCKFSNFINHSLKWKHSLLILFKPISFTIKIPSFTLSYASQTERILFDGDVSAPSFISSGLLPGTEFFIFVKQW